jgi:zeta-carotene desaturase
MSAAAALAERGYAVTLFEKRSVPGGRAGSQLNSASGEWIDNCQHILMPCCTNLLDFYRRIGADRLVRFHRTIPFIDDTGAVSRLEGGILPAPFHSFPSFMRLPFLSWRDRLRICSVLAGLIRRNRTSRPDLTAEQWLLAHGQSRSSIDLFWQPVLVSALNESLDRASWVYAAKVIIEAFLSNSKGWWLGIPRVPLRCMYGQNLLRIVEESGGQVRLQTAVESVRVRSDGLIELAVAGDGTVATRKLIAAIPWQNAAEVLPGKAIGSTDPASLGASPITGIHLWYDRDPTGGLEFAALPGRRVHWFFNKSRTHDAQTHGSCYLQLVTSASHGWMQLTKGQILEIAIEELARSLPGIRSAKLLKAYVLKEPLATFSPGPGSDELRPGTRTEIPNIFLAGDWIRTGWPATMEGAVRAGYAAAEEVLRSDAREDRVLVPDLPASGLMRLFQS